MIQNSLAVFNFVVVDILIKIFLNKNILTIYVNCNLVRFFK